MTTTLPDKGKLPKRATVAEMAVGLGLSETTIRKHARKAGLRKAADGRFTVADVLDAIISNQAEDNNAADGGPLSQARAEKVRLECEILKVRLGVLRGEFIAMDEHLAGIRECVEILTSGLERWVQAVAAAFHNPELFKMAKQVRDETRRSLAAQFREGAVRDDATKEKGAQEHE